MPSSSSANRVDPYKNRLNFYQQNTSTPTVETANQNQQQFITFPPTTPLPPKSPPPPLPSKQPPPLTAPKPQILTKKPEFQQHTIETVRTPFKQVNTTLVSSGTKMYKPSSIENLDGDFIDDNNNNNNNNNHNNNNNTSGYSGTSSSSYQQRQRYLKEQEEHFSQKEVTTQEIRQLYERKNVILTTPINNNTNNNYKPNPNTPYTFNVRSYAVVCFF